MRKFKDCACDQPLYPWAAIEADERRQRHDDAMLRVCGARREDGGAFCAGQVGHDGPHEWAREVRYMPTGWQRVPAPEWMRCQKYPEAMEGGCDKPAGHDGFCSGPTKGFADTPEPKPPTLREWLGPRVAELGPWAAVLREQPVPAGWILRWESYRTATGWELVAHGLSRSETIVPTDAIYAIGTWPKDPYGVTCEALQMALFTRHPDVKPDPRLTIGCEDQYEVMP